MTILNSFFSFSLLSNNNNKKKRNRFFSAFCRNDCKFYFAKAFNLLSSRLKLKIVRPLRPENPTTLSFHFPPPVLWDFHFPFPFTVFSFFMISGIWLTPTWILCPTETYLIQCLSFVLREKKREKKVEIQNVVFTLLVSFFFLSLYWLARNSLKRLVWESPSPKELSRIHLY